MNKIILSILFSTLFVVFNASNVFACTCRLPDLPESLEKEVGQAYENSSSVFIGKVTETVEDPNIHFITVKFKVEKTWNKKFQKEITLITDKDGSLCSYNFEVGKKYLVYASGKKNNLSASTCSRTALAEANKDIAVLNKTRKPEIKSALR
jgi:hypothetical protein